MDERIGAFFRPRSVAVVGASSNPEKLGGVILRQLASGFKGEVYAVNPRYDRIDGIPCYRSVGDIPGRVDLAVIAVRAELTPRLVEECGEAGVMGAIVIAGGFSEVGRRDLEEELAASARRSGVRLLGPNCMGVYAPSTGLDTLFTPSNLLPRPASGNVAVLTQSGSFGGIAMAMMAREGIGMSYFVSYGNRADVDEADLIDYLAVDPETRVIAVYLEGLADGRRFMESVARVGSEKPVLVFKAGTTEAGRRAAASHTGSLAGSDLVYEGALRQVGAIRARTTEEFLDLGKALSTQPPSHGPNVGVITNGGGYGVVAVDSLVRAGLRVPPVGGELRARLSRELPPFYPIGNPIDLTGNSTADQYERAVRAFMEDELYHALMVIPLFSVPALDPRETVDVLLSASEDYRKPMVVVSVDVTAEVSSQLGRLERGGIPVYGTPERAAVALAALHRRARASRPWPP